MTRFFIPIATATLTWNESDVRAINSSDEAVGRTWVSGVYSMRSFRWSRDGDVTIIDGLPGDATNYPVALNNPGTVIFVSGIEKGDYHAMVSFGGRTSFALDDLLLNCSGCSIGDIEDINDRGQILATVTVNNNTFTALLNPVPAE
jgi:hypothetical protein